MSTHHHSAFLPALLLLAACENAAAPPVVTPEELCMHLEETGCLQGPIDDCIEGFTPATEVADRCGAERNEYRRCVWVDFPADADQELSVDPFTCVHSRACENESDLLCWCERGLECGVDE